MARWGHSRRLQEVLSGLKLSRRVARQRGTVHGKLDEFGRFNDHPQFSISSPLPIQPASPKTRGPCLAGGTPPRVGKPGRPRVEPAGLPEEARAGPVARLPG